jgi:predicted small lipoprotein YifL
MKKMKKTLAVILATAMTFSLAACGGEKAEETPQQQPNTAPAESQAEAPSVAETEERDPVAIQFMHSMVEEERQQTIQGIIDKFEEEYSWITVEQVPVDGDSAYDTKLTAFAGGGMPAVIRDYIEKGTFEGSLQTQRQLRKKAIRKIPAIRRLLRLLLNFPALWISGPGAQTMKQSQERVRLKYSLQSIPNWILPTPSSLPLTAYGIRKQPLHCLPVLPATLCR